MLDISPQEPAAKPALTRVQRIKFDRWLFDHDVNNVEAARLLGVHPMSIGRWRKRFDDAKRPIPPTDVIRQIARFTGGQVRFEDWDRPCDVAYVVTPGDEGAVL